MIDTDADPAAKYRADLRRFNAANATPAEFHDSAREVDAPRYPYAPGDMSEAEYDALHDSQGRTPEHVERNERTAVVVFGAFVVVVIAVVAWLVVKWIVS